jgi:hypothetical protein
VVILGEEVDVNMQPGPIRFGGAAATSGEGDYLQFEGDIGVFEHEKLFRRVGLMHLLFFFVLSDVK